jgi:hypothetical protein
MKIPFSKKLNTTQGVPLAEGRYIATVIQIAGLGNQPAYNIGEPPVPSVGVVVQVAETQLAKRMSLSSSPWSKLFGYLNAALPDPDSYDGDNPLPLTLGCPVAIEVIVKGPYANIDSFHRPEEFDACNAPAVADTDLIFLESSEELAGDAGKALFPKLHRDIRSWLSKRVRG